MLEFHSPDQKIDIFVGFGFWFPFGGEKILNEESMVHKSDTEFLICDKFGVNGIDVFNIF